MKSKLNLFSKIWLYIIIALLFLPILVVIINSFNSSRFGTIPINFTLKWYEQLFTKSDLLNATVLSIWFSLLVALGATILGVITAIGMRNMKPRMSAFFSLFTTIPVIIPWLVLSVSLLILFNVFSIGRSYVSMFFGNLIVCLPYVVLMVSSRFTKSSTITEDAARTLGAKTMTILLKVTLPSALPAILSGSLMAFVVCFNNFVMQYYLAPFGVRTLPLEIYNMVRVGCEPDINALATIIILFTVIPLIVIHKLGYSNQIAVKK